MRLYFFSPVQATAKRHMVDVIKGEEDVPLSSGSAGHQNVGVYFHPLKKTKGTR